MAAAARPAMARWRDSGSATVLRPVAYSTRLSPRLAHTLIAPPRTAPCVTQAACCGVRAVTRARRARPTHDCRRATSAAAAGAARLRGHGVGDLQHRLILEAAALANTQEGLEQCAAHSAPSTATFASCTATQPGVRERGTRRPPPAPRTHFGIDRPRRGAARAAAGSASDAGVAAKHARGAAAAPASCTGGGSQAAHGGACWGLRLA
eukprot:361800-Chlamydomonas_euryale.AAC.5